VAGIAAGAFADVPLWQAVSSVAAAEAVNASVNRVVNEAHPWVRTGWFMAFLDGWLGVQPLSAFYRNYS